MYGMKKREDKKIGKPSRLLWFFAFLVLYPWYRLRYRASFVKKGVKAIKGPALVLCPHTAICDPFIIGVALYPARPNYVASAHVLAKPLFRRLLSFVHIIPKRMFTKDISTVLNIRRAMREGNVVVLFPEGRLSCWGQSLPLIEGTADMVARLGVPVYKVVNNGAYLTFPKWGKYPRVGKIRVETSLLFEENELKGLSVEEIRCRLEEALCHNDERAMAGQTYRCRDISAGVDGILYRCPVCQKEGTIGAKGGKIFCDCGFSCTLNRDYTLTGAPFASIDAWYRWQEACLDLDTPLKSVVTVGSPDEKGDMKDDAGGGEMTLTRESFSFNGEVFGKPLSFTLKLSGLGFPVTVSHHFDVYYENKLYCMQPLPDRRIAVKWVSFLDKVNAEEAKKALTPMP